jgi:hypothetical protein
MTLTDYLILIIDIYFGDFITDKKIKKLYISYKNIVDNFLLSTDKIITLMLRDIPNINIEIRLITHDWICFKTDKYHSVTIYRKGQKKRKTRYDCHFPTYYDIHKIDNNFVRAKLSMLEDLIMDDKYIDDDIKDKIILEINKQSGLIE